MRRSERPAGEADGNDTYIEIHAGAGATLLHAGADKLARDAFIWTHLAGDSVQRMKAVRGLKLK